MKNLIVENQNIIHGSSHLRGNKKFFKIDYMTSNMADNTAYKEYLKQNQIFDKEDKKKILQKFVERYKRYRKDWISSHETHYKNFDAITSAKIDMPSPLCVDIETASICDLACPHCFRDHIMTPDKIMKESLYKKIIDSISKQKVPSIKLNWRGEPLLNPKLYDFIKYAKSKGILEIIINTNATKLNSVNAKKLINSGIDEVVFSFDGGTKKTYDKMRPGRFHNNKFEDVYNNIKNFDLIKKEMNSKFPITKIQMVLTEDTREEIESFHELFKDCVDDVTVIHYHERGGNFSQLQKKVKDKLDKYLLLNNLPQDTPYLVSADEKIFISQKRKACSQLFQRMMVTYDGRVGMCCHDWGAQHCVGFIDEEAFNEEEVISKLESSIKSNKKGFELLKDAKKPKKYYETPKKVDDIMKIWSNEEFQRVRGIHSKNNSNEIEMCKTCVFVDTYDWQPI